MNTEAVYFQVNVGKTSEKTDPSFVYRRNTHVILSGQWHCKGGPKLISWQELKQKMVSLET